MRGGVRKYLMPFLTAALCAAGGCASQQITSKEGPLTPYSPVAAASSAGTASMTAAASSNGPSATLTAQPMSSSGDPAGPLRYDPGTVDPRLLSEDEPEPTWVDRLTESTSPKKIGAKFKQLTGRGPDEDVARHNYNEADLAFREKRYEDALKCYKIAADRWPDSSLQEDALFMAAECYFQLNRYPKASDTYTKLVKKYENSRYLDLIVKRRFAIGRYWEQRSKQNPIKGMNFKDKSMPVWDTVGNTVAIYESIRMDDPTGPLADDATMATANVLFLNGRWEDAGYHYDLIRTEFPQSDFQPQAHLLGMQAKLRSYQGPHYDAKPLMDAKKLGHSLQTQFAAQLPNERENIQQTLKTIDAQIAERDWSLGEFYYGTQHYTAARYYYGEVVKQYPHSRFADLARNRIDEVKDKPPDPKDEIELLANLFRRTPTPAPQAPDGSPTAAPQGQPAIAGAPSGQAPAEGSGGVPSVAQQPQAPR